MTSFILGTRRVIIMTTINLRRMSGLAAILAGGLSIMLTIPALGLENVWTHTLQGVLLLFGIMGVYLCQHRECGVLGFLGFLLASIGSALFLVSNGDARADSFQVGGIATGLGFILLGIGSWAAGRLPRWIPLFWILSSVVGIPAVFIVSMSGTLLLLSAIIFALGFIGAGFKLLSGTNSNIVPH
jgi:hypothetical protein